MKKFLFLIALITVSNVSISFAQESSHKITLEDIFSSGTFTEERLPGLTPMADDEHYLVTDNDSINIYSYKSGRLTGTLVTGKDLIPDGDSIPITMRSYSLSNDEKQILFTTKTEHIYRRSSKSYYYIYSIPEKSLVPLSENGKQMHATFSPDGKYIAFVRDNNLFYYNISTKTEKKITSDGELNKIINGSADWVYEEEFHFSKAFFWSPDSKKIAFYRFNESKVKEFTMMMWGDLYPQPYTFKYPKAGEENSIIDIQVYHLDSGEFSEMDIGAETDIYIPRIKWTNDSDLLSIQWMNRLQNQFKIILTDASTGKPEIIYNETNKYYINITDDLTFLKNNDGFIITSEQDGFNHIYLYDILGNLEQQITKGDWEVDQLKGIDEEGQWIYFTSTESSPLNRELYRIRFDGSQKTRISEREGTNNANFSNKFKYFINTFSDANTPPIVEVYSAKGKRIRSITENLKLKEAIQTYNFSKKEFFNFLTSDVVRLNGWMIKPPNFNPDYKYPVLMYVYGGPGSQTVTNSWSRRNSWFQMLAQQGIIVVSVDNRGTGGRGEKFKKATYMQLGKYETIDQIEAAQYLGSLDYVDFKRIGIWGWSYGGFMAANCMTQGSDWFSMGIAVAPVTNWRYYDNIYTERFMRTPMENPEGYDNNSPINHTEKLKGKFLLIHGTADDNVHLQNSMDLITALVSENKQFEMQFYPNSNHGIYTGKNTTYHLYKRMTDFILENLNENH